MTLDPSPGHDLARRIIWLHPETAAPLHPRLHPSDFTPRLQTSLLVLQATPFCNIDCDYCYLPSRELTHRMSTHVARAAARRLIEDELLGADLSVIWHAGEPLTAPISFYREAFTTLADELGGRTRITHSIQTNATLINGEWCALFRDFNVRVGVSIDGPAAIHDAYRKTRSGKGTFAKVMRGIECLHHNAVPFHSIAVVTDHSVNEADALYTFFAALGTSELCLNFDEAEGVHARSSIAASEAAFRAFLMGMMDRMTSSGGKLIMREFSHALRLATEGLQVVARGATSFPYNVQTLPFTTVSVGWNGDFSTFSPEMLGQPEPRYENFVLGNVLRETYLDSTCSENFHRLHGAITHGVELCRNECEYFNYCGGGAPINKLAENGTFESTETLYCRNTMKAPFDIVLARLESALAARPPTEPEDRAGQ